MPRETLHVDNQIVGAGPAGLSAALRVMQLQKANGGEPLSVAVLEKAREAGAHSLSGAILDPSALGGLIPDFRNQGAPLASEVREDSLYFLTKGSRVAFPVSPPPLRNHGHYIISINELVRWLAARAEAEGIDLFTGFAGQDVLMDGRRVVGVRTGDRGVGRDGHPKGGFEAGVDIAAQVTIFCDGVRGNLTKQLLRRLELGANREPEQFALGLKELWDVPPGRIRAGAVMHTLGYPLKQDEFGGGFVYAMSDTRVSLGFVAGLDYRDPMFDPHSAFNRFKRHPLIADLIEGGQLVRYGAKALPEGGWNTIPKTYMDGGLIAGDAGGFLNSMRLKGIHLAMRTGMLAAETAFDAVRAGDTTEAALSSYQARIDASPVRSELYPVRNVHQAFGHGLFAGLMVAGLSLLTRGGWPVRLKMEPGHQRMRRLAASRSNGGVPPAASQPPPIDRRLTFDRITNVHYSGTAHAEDQPAHLLVHTEVCSSICGPEYGHPCTRFCPANVYEIEHAVDGTPRLQINASNCVHCKACDIMDPYAVITWVPPEGGGGPQYNGM
jgi:electron-transferring-flavoprotein dehydrogenase